MRLKTNEWHELSLRKDISFIRNNINKGQNDIAALLFEVLLAVISMTVDHVLADSSVDMTIRICVAVCFGVAIFIFGIYWGIKKWCHYKKMNWAIKHNKIDGKHYIDEFDNTICYIAMAAHSYVEMYTESQSIAEKQFYQLECEYYLRKCIKTLYLMRNHIPNIFCKEEENSSASMIDCRRLENIIALLKDIDDFLNKTNYTCKLKNEYKSEINEFLGKYNAYFSASLTWKNQKDIGN